MRSSPSLRARPSQPRPSGAVVKVRARGRVCWRRGFRRWVLHGSSVLRSHRASGLFGALVVVRRPLPRRRRGRGSPASSSQPRRCASASIAARPDRSSGMASMWRANPRLLGCQIVPSSGVHHTRRFRSWWPLYSESSPRSSSFAFFGMRRSAGPVTDATPSPGALSGAVAAGFRRRRRTQEETRWFGKRNSGAGLGLRRTTAERRGGP